MGSSKKHERGDRGSVEEGVNTVKKSNMLVVNPSILVSIQSTVFTSSQENQSLKREFAELKDSMSFNERELEGFKDSLGKVSKTNVSLQKELTKTREELEHTKMLLKEEKDKTLRVWGAFDDLEQYTRKTSSVEVHGIPEHAYSDTESVVIKIANALNV